MALVAWVTMCVLADVWQVGRALGGNSLSFLYAVEWPCFGVLGFFGWWMLLHNEKPSASLERARKEYEEKMRAQAAAARAVDAVEHEEDPQLAAYNDHLATLADVPKKKLWKH